MHLYAYKQSDSSTVLVEYNMFYRLGLAAGSQQSRCAAGHHVHARRGDSAASERRLRSPSALAHVLPLAVL